MSVEVRGIRLLEASYISGCEPSSVDAGNGTLVLCENNKYS